MKKGVHVLCTCIFGNKNLVMFQKKKDKDE